jgi:dipeptidyl aminopeptidase/acylaminoacyl peptidase
MRHQLFSEKVKSMLFSRSKFLMAAAAIVMSGSLAAQTPAPSSQSVKERVPTWVFGKRPFMNQPRISPDGSKIAVKLARDGNEFLGIIDLNKPGSKPEFIVANTERRNEGDRTVEAWRWVGNDHVVFTLASRERIFGQLADVSRLVAFNLTSKKKVPLAWDGATGQASEVEWIDHENGKLVLERQSNAYGQERWQLPEVVMVDVKTGKFTVTMQPNPVVGDWIVDGKGVVRAGIGGDGDSGKERLMYRSDAKGTMKTVSNEADATFTGANIVPEIFLDEPDMAIATSNKSGFRRVYKVNMKTLQLSEPIFGRDGYDVGTLYSNQDQNKLVGVQVTEERELSHWLDPDWKTIQSLMDEQFGKGNAQIVSRDLKEERLIFFVGKPSQPGAYYLFDTKTGRLATIGWYHPLLKEMTLNPMSTVTYKASDGLKIPTVVTMPRHRMGQKNLPVIVMPHGGPFGVRDQEEFGFFPWHQAMAELGYVVLQPNYRGSGGYGKEFVLKGRGKDGYGMRMQDDLNDALTWFGAQGTIDPKRACIMGWSYGGYATARGAQRDPDVWKCAIAGAGVYDFPMMKRFDQKTFGDFGANFQATVDNLNEISSARNTDGKWAPIMIVAGVRDARIPIEQSRTLVSRLKASGKKQGVDFDYIEQPQGTHNLPYEDVHIEWLEAAERWSARFNPAYIETDKDKPVPIATRFQKGTTASGK